MTSCLHGFPPNPLIIFNISHACQTHSPSHPLWFECPNYAWWVVQIMKFFITQLVPFSCYFYPLKPKWLLSILSLNAVRNTRKEVSRGHKVTFKIVVLKRLTSVSEFLDGKRLEKEFWIELKSSKYSQNSKCLSFLCERNLNLLFQSKASELCHITRGLIRHFYTVTSDPL